MNTRASHLRHSARPAPAPAAAGPKALLQSLFTGALQALRGETLVEQASQFDGRRWRWTDGRQTCAMDIPADGRVLVIGAGKAAANLALGLERVLGDRIDGGLIIVKDGHRQPLRRIEQVEAGHPVPDARGLDGTCRMRRLLADLRPQDRVFVVITGGASSLLVAPAAGLDLAAKAELTRQLLLSGATIREMNTVRGALSEVKCGGLLRWIAPAQSVTLVVSDVPDDCPDLIGSGPSLPVAEAREEPLEILTRYGVIDALPTQLRTALAASRREEPNPSACPAPLVIADRAALVSETARLAREAGLNVRLASERMCGDTHEEARRFSDELAQIARTPGARPTLLIAAGETTLRVAGSGMGGRNQEFALVAARALAGTPDVWLLAAGSDGTDGPTDAAGAIVSGSSWNDARGHGLDPAAYLANNDSHRLFGALGDLVVTGPTGTNVMDLVLGLALPPGATDD